ncbi:MAG: hypothetical protein GY947_10495 [Rhodobacteraceae bacterium]|nr:hypothetical protein [Paracoccaceae bacterium]
MPVKKPKEVEISESGSMPEEDLWFLPGPPEDFAPTDMPWPVVNQRPLFVAENWRRGEMGQARALVEAATAFARLDERLRSLSPGAVERLALMEVADIAWAQGEWIPAEKIALYRHLRVSTLENAKALSTAAWAMRRMLGGMRPEAGLANYLGRQHVEHDSLAELGRRAVGEAFDSLELAWLAILDDLKDVHPITLAGVSYYAWRSLGLSEPAAVIEAAVVAGKIGSTDGKTLGFLPLAVGNRAVFGQSGSTSDKLALWYAAVRDACLRAHLLFDQLAEWKVRAQAATQDLSGRTPPALIEALLKSPVLSTELATEITGCSRATAQRNLAIFDDRGLILETTGQGRYRFWRAAV